MLPRCNSCVNLAVVKGALYRVSWERSQEVEMGASTCICNRSAESGGAYFIA